MINGTNPLIIFKFYDKTLKWKAGEPDSEGRVGEEITLKDWQQMTEYHRDVWHRPIIVPLYLNEDIFKIATDEATQDIKTDTANMSGFTFQGAVASITTFQIRAAKDNLLMIMLISALKQVSDLIANQHYSVTLYYDATFVLNGLFTSIQQATVTNTNEKIITLTISENAQKKEEKKSGAELNNTSSDSEFNPGLTNTAGA